MKNVVKSSKHFFGYFNTLETHSDLLRVSSAGKYQAWDNHNAESARVDENKSFELDLAGSDFSCIKPARLDQNLHARFLEVVVLQKLNFILIIIASFDRKE